MTLGIAGLAFSFVGAVLLFVFGLPPRVRENGERYLLLEGEDKDEIEKGKRYRRISKLGLSFLAVGFLLQLLGEVIQRFC